MENLSTDATNKSAWGKKSEIVLNQFIWPDIIEEIQINDYLKVGLEKNFVSLLQKDENLVLTCMISTNGGFRLFQKKKRLIITSH